LALALENNSAAAAPIPLLAPVIIIVLFCRSIDATPIPYPALIRGVDLGSIPNLAVKSSTLRITEFGGY
jgi:hypothetical protein